MTETQPSPAAERLVGPPRRTPGDHPEIQSGNQVLREHHRRQARLVDEFVRRECDCDVTLSEALQLVRCLSKTRDGRPRIPRSYSEHSECWAFVELRFHDGRTKPLQLRCGTCCSDATDPDEPDDPEGAEFDGCDGSWAYLPVSACYSTRELALAAHEEEKSSD